MGIYINPIKEEHPTEKWDIILKITKEVSQKEFINHIPGQDDKFGICLIDNGAFVAAGVAFNLREAECMISPYDGRRKVFCLLTVDQIQMLDPHCAEQLRSLPKE